MFKDDFLVSPARLGVLMGYIMIPWYMMYRQKDYQTIMGYFNRLKTTFWLPSKVLSGYIWALGECWMDVSSPLWYQRYKSCSFFTFFHLILCLFHECGGRSYSSWISRQKEYKKKIELISGSYWWPSFECTQSLASKFLGLIRSRIVLIIFIKTVKTLPPKTFHCFLEWEHLECW